MNTPQYDFIFAGGGLAGLSLAYHLAHSTLQNRSMLIVDRDAKTRNDRTWCFWTKDRTPFDPMVQRTWKNIHFASDRFQQTLNLGDYGYKVIRGFDFYHALRQELCHSNIQFRQGHVETINETADGARITVDGKAYNGHWVFDSRFSIKLFQPDRKRFHYLPQFFTGWEIETPDDTFDPQTATLMDFRMPQRNAMRFFYVLPFSARRALVEYVTTAPDNYDSALRTYIKQSLHIDAFHIMATEGGVNPMSDYVFPRQASAHVMNIGTRGGRLKPSTGYAFQRIQQDSAAIVQSLLNYGHPFTVPADSRRYRWYDTLMLDVMQNHGDQIQSIFAALFQHNPTARILRFLDEVASPLENLALIQTLPPRLFLQALAQKTTTDYADFTEKNLCNR